MADGDWASRFAGLAERRLPSAVGREPGMEGGHAGYIFGAMADSDDSLKEGLREIMRPDDPGRPGGDAPKPSRPATPERSPDAGGGKRRIPRWAETAVRVVAAVLAAVFLILFAFRTAFR